MDGSGAPDEFKTRVIPQQAKQPVAPSAPSSPFSSHEDAGNLLSMYSIRGKIGSGGMGVVYIAVDRRLGRYVAIKRLNPGLRDELSVRRRFLHEAKAAAALNNVHIAHIYSIGEDEDGPFIVMEYVESSLPKTDLNGPCPPQTLEHYVEQNGPFKLDDALMLMLKIGHAMEAAHAAGVIHRDLKASNILMDAAGEPKIVDFGLARLTRPDIASNLTVVGEKFISLGYGAPEQESDATLSDERADVYGLGALLYFALTGKNPRFFREEDLPSSVRPVICKALAMDRDERYQTVVGFDAALTMLLSEAKTERPTVKTTWRCKWCDTINPLTTRFCGECGWDGREQCRECGADQHVGIQFCGVCGANARDYESAAMVLRKIRNAIESRQFEWAVNYAAQPMTFEPVGPNGRQMLDEIQALGATAQKRFQRRDTLRGIITAEMSSENYERAQRFIQEFRDLSSSNDAYSDELSSIPSLIQKRDLLRIHKAFAMQDWELGERLLHTMAEVDSEGLPERTRLLRALGKHARNVFLVRASCVILALFALYVLAMPMMVRLDVPGTRMLWTPAYEFSTAPAVGDLVGKYASLWGVDDLPAYFLADRAISDRPTSDVPESVPMTLSILQRNFKLQMRDADEGLATIEKEWGDEYVKALTELREQNRLAGYFDNWKVVDQELSRFQEAGTLREEGADIPGILVPAQEAFRGLRDKRRAEVFRRKVTVTRKYIDELDKNVRDLTKNGQMAEADRFNEVLKAIRSDNAYFEAERVLAEYDARHPEGAISNYAGLIGNSDHSEELQQPRSKYDESLKKADDELARGLAKWEEEYLNALIELKTQRQREGDFLGLQAAGAEMSRFELDRVIPAAAPPTESAYLDQMRDRFMNTRQEIEDNHAKMILGASTAYDRALADLASRHTKAGKIEAAAVAVAERRHVAMLPEVVAARTRIEAKQKAADAK